MKPIVAPWVLLALSLPRPAAARPPESPAEPLPIRQVTLFSSGVGFFERSGSLTGDAVVPLRFRAAQINDLLKSMVLIDEKGQVRPAVYATRDPIGRTLQSFAVNLTPGTTLADLLGRLRGAGVAVEGRGHGRITGQIVGVEERSVAGAEGKPVTASFLTVLAERGLTSVRLDPGTTVRLLDERLRRDLESALGVLAAATNNDSRTVDLRFDGTGTREVHVGYLMEAPLWKMSYRLLLGGPAGGEVKPYLQGWAIVENTSDEDWNDVRLSLVSGRPVSFIQDLYQPLYLPRPVVPPDVVASPYPQTHGSDLTRGVAEAAAAERPGSAGPAAPPGPPSEGADRAMDLDNAAFGRAKVAPRIAGGALGGGAFGGYSASVQAEASGEHAGDLFAYTVKTPVSLPRHRAALIPVVTAEVGAEKVSIYNADAAARFPLRGVRLTNSTGVHLKGGPVTVLDAGVYAGDARMEETPPGDSRLISYAVDVGVEGERQGPSASSVQVSLSLRAGVLTVTSRERQEATYTLKSRIDEARRILVEHPFHAEYTLAEPAEPLERTAQVYRFAVDLPARASRTLKVVVQRPLSSTVAVLEADTDSLVEFTRVAGISPEMRRTLDEIVRRRRAVQGIRAQAAARQAAVAAITADQERIRKNMAALDAASDLYKRYVKELTEQENRIQAARVEADGLTAQAEKAQAELAAYVDGLTTGSAE
ncbi:MAG: hypothetical protein IT208_07515 [Chthonomonadales bacterium]|nr:hypothetical protein [Chthonomonadales bacterium]